jgi:hypothetical protein
MWNVNINEENTVIVSSCEDGGGFEIHCFEDQNPPLFEIYSIPMFGGEPVFDCGFFRLTDALQHSQTYT